MTKPKTRGAFIHYVDFLVFENYENKSQKKNREAADCENLPAKSFLIELEFFFVPDKIFEVVNDKVFLGVKQELFCQ